MKRIIRHRRAAFSAGSVSSMFAFAVAVMLGVQAFADGNGAAKSQAPAPSMQVGAADLRAIWNDPSFQKSFVAGYGVNPEVEPRISTIIILKLIIVQKKEYVKQI